MAEWQTKTIVLDGGTRSSTEPVAQEAIYPGSLIDSLNVEAGEEGGYQRLAGFAKYSSAEVTGSGPILGAFVFNNGVIACRNDAFYFGTGGAWSSNLAPSARTNAGYYKSDKYTWGTTERIVLVDGVNKPVKYDGTTATDLTNAQAGATCVKEFKNHLFIGVGGTLYYSSPNDDTDWSGGSGGGNIVIGDNINALGIWRDNLYAFCTGSIHKVTGNNNNDFAEDPVTEIMGCEHGHTLKEVAGDLFFLSNDGIRTISGTEESGDVALESVSKKLKSTVKGIHTNFDNGIITSILVSSKGQYRLFGSDSALATQPDINGVNVCITEDLQEQTALAIFKLAGIDVTTGDSDFADGLELVVHGSSGSGYIYKQETGDNFDGANIEAFIQLPYLVFDDPMFRKTIHRMTVHANAGENGNAISELTAQLFLNDNDPTIIQPTSIDLTGNIPGTAAIYGFTGGVGGGSKYGTMIYGQGVSPKYLAYPSGSAQNVSIKLSSNDTLPAWAVKTLIIEYELGDRV